MPEARLDVLARDRGTGDPPRHPTRACVRRQDRRRRRRGDERVSTLRVAGLRAAVDGQEILRGVDLEVASGEVHALMGPNGSGKSTLAHALMGRPDYEILGGSVTLDGEELLGLPTWERAAKGLFLAMQYPVEVAGVRLVDFLGAAIRGRGGEPNGLTDRLAREAGRMSVGARFLTRGGHVASSGREPKRAARRRVAAPEHASAGL